MKKPNAKLVRLYLKALAQYLVPGELADPQAAVVVGRRAVALRLDTLDLARIHEQSLVVLLVPFHSNREKVSRIRRATVFFSEANAQIEQNNLAARRIRSHLGQVMAQLEKRTVELAASNMELKEGVARRKTLEQTSQKRGKVQEKRLKESIDLQDHLRKLTHRVLAAQEDERKKISRELQDEIAQTLLGINVRLLSLKQEARSNTKAIRNGIASTQKLVAKSARSVREVGRKISGI